MGSTLWVTRVASATDFRFQLQVAADSAVGATKVAQTITYGGAVTDERRVRRLGRRRRQQRLADGSFTVGRRADDASAVAAGIASDFNTADYDAAAKGHRVAVTRDGAGGDFTVGDRTVTPLGRSAERSVTTRTFTISGHRQQRRHVGAARRHDGAGLDGHADVGVEPVGGRGGAGRRGHEGRLHGVRDRLDRCTSRGSAARDELDIEVTRGDVGLPPLSGTLVQRYEHTVELNPAVAAPAQEGETWTIRIGTAWRARCTGHRSAARRDDEPDRRPRSSPSSRARSPA